MNIVKPTSVTANLKNQMVRDMEIGLEFFTTINIYILL